MGQGLAQGPVVTWQVQTQARLCSHPWVNVGPGQGQAYNLHTLISKCTSAYALEWPRRTHPDVDTHKTRTILKHPELFPARSPPTYHRDSHQTGSAHRRYLPGCWAHTSGHSFTHSFTHQTPIECLLRTTQRSGHGDTAANKTETLFSWGCRSSPAQTETHTGSTHSVYAPQIIIANSGEGASVLALLCQQRF